jgi:hypothetical protein
MAATHVAFNQVPDLADLDTAADLALIGALHRYRVEWQIDEVEFCPARHQLPGAATGLGLGTL